MERVYRPVIGVNQQTGEVKKWESVYKCATELSVAVPGVTQTMDRGGATKGWRLYDTQENIRRQIATLERRLEEVAQFEKAL